VLGAREGKWDVVGAMLGSSVGESVGANVGRLVIGQRPHVTGHVAANPLLSA